jgi:hypothetical protein
MSAMRDELHRLVDQLDYETVPGAIELLRELAARNRRAGALEHYSTLAAGWDFEGWERHRAAEKDSVRLGRRETGSGAREPENRSLTNAPRLSQLVAGEDTAFPRV